jgi:hypothetical protein
MSIGAIKAGFLTGVAIGLMAVPAVIAKADSDEQAPRWIASVVFFENANACQWAGVPAQVCQAGYRSAYRQHIRIAPAYHDEASCEADFVTGECFVSGPSRLWTPWLSGFSLITHAQLPAPTSHSVKGREVFAIVSRSWSQRLQGISEAPEPATQVRYFSEPLYWERDHQGGIRLTSLREKLRNGERFANAFSKRPPVTSGSALWTRQLARLFEPQRLIDVATP